MAVVTQVLDTHLVDVSDVARVLGTTPRSVQRWNSDSSSPRKDTEDRLIELEVVLQLALEVMTDSAARLWLRTPNPTLDWDKPLEVVGRGDYKHVIDALHALSEGVMT